MVKVYILIGVLSTLTAFVGAWMIMAKMGILMFKGRKKNKEIDK
jgi:hypothetical protein